MVSLLVLFGLLALSSATPVLYDGRAPFNLTGANLDSSQGPYLTAVKGKTENATHYATLLGYTTPPTPLWNKELIPFLPFPILSKPTEQAISISIDNSSIFVPGTNAPQYGFRRIEFIAQNNNDHTSTFPTLETGMTAFHFSIKADEKRPLNYDHEYQIVFIEPNDGSHIFGIQLGSPFTNPTGALPAKDAHSFKVLDHALNVLYTAPFTSNTWHNFAIQVDWTNRSLAVLYSKDNDNLKAVSKVVPNLSAASGSAGQGDFHFGVLKLPLVDSRDTPADQGDVVHHGIQEGTTEALLYSGVFVESVSGGISVGHGRTIAALVV